jgi:hypothetical protein
MLGVEFARFLVLLILANAFLRLALSIAVRKFPNTDVTNALAFVI